MAIVVTWNVAGRVRTVGLQAEALATQPADLIALQEIRLSSLAAWRAALRELGFEHVITSLDGHDPNVPLAPERRLGVLIAGRAPVEALPAPPGVPWPERVLSARTELGELLNLHAPIWSKAEEAKVRPLEAVYEHLAADGPAGSRVLVGDLNTPQY